MDNRMMPDKGTPEEKLLKIIENPLAQRRKILPGGGAYSPVNIRGLTGWIKKLRFNKDAIKNINLKIINRATIAICLILTAIFIFDFISFGEGSKKRLQQISQEASATEIKDKKIFLEEVGVSEVVSLAKRHNIFTFVQPEPELTSDQNMMTEDVAQLLADLKLVGILWSANPQVMLESAREQKTYLLNTGEQVGQLSVKKILKDKVVLSKDNQEWEIR